MKLEIFAEDKPAEKVFEYKLEVADNVLLLSTAMLSGAIALASLFSALKDSLTASIFLLKIEVFQSFQI